MRGSQKKLSGDFLICTKPSARPTRLYIHYDIPTGDYLVQEQQNGSCVFTEQKARNFIKLFLDSDNWMTERLDLQGPNVQHLSKDSREGKKFIKSLEKLPGYTKTKGKGECAVCGAATRNLCSGCMSVRNCNESCQQQHWDDHKLCCGTKS